MSKAKKHSKRHLRRRNPEDYVVAMPNALIAAKNRAVQKYHDAKGLLKPLEKAELQKLALKAADLEGQVAQYLLDDALINLTSQGTLLCAGGQIKKGYKILKRVRSLTQKKSLKNWVTAFLKEKRPPQKRKRRRR